MDWYYSQRRYVEEVAFDIADNYEAMRHPDAMRANDVTRRQQEAMLAVHKRSTEIAAEWQWLSTVLVLGPWVVESKNYGEKHWRTWMLFESAVYTKISVVNSRNQFPIFGVRVEGEGVRSVSPNIEQMRSLDGRYGRGFCYDGVLYLALESGG